MQSSFIAQYTPPSGAESKLLRSGSATAGHPSLPAAASEFESVLLGQWLGGAESSFGTVPGSEEDEDAGGEQMRSFGTQQLAQAFTKAGGIGIAAMVEKSFAGKGSIKAG